MRRGWTQVALGEVVSHRTEFFEIDDLSDYMRCRVKLHAQGVELRDKAPGALIKTKRQQRCHASDFLVAEIDAKVGGYGLVPSFLDGAVVSSHYFLFKADPAFLLPEFLGFFARTRRFADQVKARGSTNYAAIRPSNVLGYSIPLPSLADQRSVVAQISAIETRLHRVQALREEQTKELQAALRSAFHHLEARSKWMPMGDVIPLNRRPVEIEPDGRYPELGARSFGRGIFHKPTLKGDSLTWEKLFRVQAGDLVISNIKAWEGALAVASEGDGGRFGSHRYLTCTADRTRLLPEFACFYLLSPHGLEQIGNASPGSADRNRTLSVSRLEKILIPVPPLAAQREFQKLLALQSQVKARAEESKAATTALLPSLLGQIFNG